MFRQFRARFAFSLAVLAVAALSVMPAYAAPAGGPSHPQAPPQEPQAVQFQPDIQVTVAGEPYFREYNQTWVYRFRVTNIGAASSGAIAVKGVCHYTNPNDDVMNHTVMAKVIGGLLSDHSTQISVVCDRTPDITTGAPLPAGTQNDLDPSNNVATSQ